MKYIFGIILFCVVLLPFDVSAQAVVPGGFVSCNGTDCSACNLVEMANEIIIWLFGIIFLIFATIMVVAGFGLVTSGGNQSALQAAKSKFTNAIIGVIIVMSAWILVDTVMRQLVKGDGDLALAGFKGFGPWSEVECTRQTETIIPDPDSSPSVTGSFSYQAFLYDATNSCRVGKSGSFSTIDLCESSLASALAGPGEKYVVANCPNTPISSTPPTWANAPICTTAGSPTADGQFTWQGNIQAQLIHASAPLASMLTCMAGKVPGNVGNVSSISDENIINGNKTWAQCRLGGCNHTANSDHYGNNGRCGDKSYAVDFGDEQNVVELCKAANSCGSVRSCSVHNGNHVHISLNVSC